MATTQTVNQLGGDADPVASFADAALEDEPNTEFPADIRDIECFILVCER